MIRYLRVSDFGKKDFADFYKLNYRMWLQRLANDISDSLVFAEHPHVILVGTQGSVKEVLIPSALNRREEIPVYETEWSGGSTYRGPGQLVIYPVINLNRYGMTPLDFQQQVEEILIKMLAQYGIKGERKPGKSGVWVGDLKIASHDVEVCQRVTRHSIALNVNPRLSLFRMLHSPDGEVRKVTSMYHILKRKVDTGILKVQFSEYFQDAFGLKAETAQY